MDEHSAMQFGIMSVSDITRDPTTGVTPSERERIQATLTIAKHAEEVGLDVFAIGDAAAVPNVAEPDSEYCPPTAQYANSQASTAARNVADSILGRPLTQFRHKDLGLVVDLSGRDALARVLGLELSGYPALGTTRGYHMFSVPSNPARARILANWAIRAFTGGEVSRLGFADGTGSSSFASNESVEYLDAENARREGARLLEHLKERQRQD